MSVKTSGVKAPMASKIAPVSESKGMGTKGKILLAAGAAVVAVAATVYALRRYPKKDGIVPNLRRLGKRGKKFLTKKGGIVPKLRGLVTKKNKMVVKKTAKK